jgi:hypothetical protein
MYLIKNLDQNMIPRSGHRLHISNHYGIINNKVSQTNNSWNKYYQIHFGIYVYPLLPGLW